MWPHSHAYAENTECIEISLMSNDARSKTMQQWEYYFVFATVTNDGEFRPRFANDQETD